MQRNMPPVPHDTRALFIPRHSPFAREVIPVEFFFIELPYRPTGKVFEYVTLRDKWPETWSVRRGREFVLKVLI